jgi:hypothetical protein
VILRENKYTECIASTANLPLDPNYYEEKEKNKRQPRGSYGNRSVLQSLGIVVEQPIPPLSLSPENGVRRCVDLHFGVSLALLVAVLDVEDVLVLSGLALDDGCAGEADGLVLVQRGAEGGGCCGAEDGTEDGGVLDGLRGALCEVGKHRVATARSTWLGPEDEV